MVAEQQAKAFFDRGVVTVTGARSESRYSHSDCDDGLYSHSDCDDGLYSHSDCDDVPAVPGDTARPLDRTTDGITARIAVRGVVDCLAAGAVGEVRAGVSAATATRGGER